MSKHAQFKHSLLVLIIAGLTACSTEKDMGRPQALPAAPHPIAEGQQGTNDTQAGDAPSTEARDNVPVDAEKSEADTHPKTQIIRGTGSFLATPSVPAMETMLVGEANTINFNFVNADVRDVAKSVLGDFLKINYAIAANVQGNVTIQTTQPLSHDAVLPVLEQALRLNNMAIVRAGAIYKVVPLTEAPHESSIEPRSAVLAGVPGYGIEIVPINYVGATEMARLLQPITPVQGAVHIDAIRNLLIIEGTGPERATLLDAIALFDVDWLMGMSFALYTPNNTDATGLVAELNQVLGGPNNPLAGLVRFVPIVRLNAVLAISPQPKYLEEIQDWVERLDRPSQGTDRRLFVYHVQNGRASDIAAVLLKALFSQGMQQNGGSSGFPPPSQPSFEGNGLGGGAQSIPGPMASSFMPPPPPPSGLGSAFFGQQGQFPAPSNSQSITSGGAGGSSITADEKNNALVILSTPQEYTMIQAALRQLDTPALQVLLEAVIAEVTLTNDLQYGVQFFYQKDNEHLAELSSSASALIGPSFPGFSYILTHGTNIKLVLNALASVTHVEIISSPQLLVLNNQVATLQVGDQVPIISEQAVSTLSTGAPIVNSVQYHDTGVILRITPRVNDGGSVMMDVAQEVSSVASTTTSAIDSPTIAQRRINSTVVVQDNETVALGGLISQSKQTGRSGIPFLQDIPVLGNVFRTTDNRVNKTELLVLITPHVIDSTQKARAVTNELRQKLPAVRALLEKSR